MSNYKILVVEDESIEAMGVEQSLKSFNYDVVGISSSGEDALEKIAQFKPDLVLMDIILIGKLDGIETAKKIKEYFDIPVVYLTAHTDDSLVERAKISAPYGYLKKPFNKIELKNIIDLALVKHEMELQLNKINEDLIRAQRVAKIGSWENNLATNDLQWSEEMYKILGFPINTPVNLEEVTSIFSPEELIRFQEAVNAAINEDAPYSMDYKIIRPDGSVRYIHDEGEVVYNEKGEHKSMFGTTQDITKRKLAEEALSGSEENFRAIAENANDGILIAADKGSHVYVNPRAVDIFGYSKEELLKTSIEDLAHPDELRNLMKGYKARISGKSLPAIYDTYETRIMRKNNKVVPIQITSAKTIWNGKPAVMSIIRDINELRRIKNSLKENEKKYRTLFDADPDYTILLGMDGIIQDVNDATTVISGLSKEDLIGKNFSELEIIPKEDLSFHLEKINSLLRGESVNPFQSQFIDKEGNIHWVLIHLSAIMKDENICSILGIASDITEEKTAENSLKESEKRLSEIIDFLPDATFAIDDQGKVITWNHAIEEMTGIKARNIMGKGDYEYSIPFYYVRRPILIDLVSKPENKLKKHYNNIIKEENAIMAEVKTTDGFLWGKAVPLYDNEGKIAGAIESIRDITKRKNVEFALKKSEERFRAVAESAVDAIVTTDVDGNIIFFNNSLTEIFGYKEEELKGKPLTLLMPERFRKEYLNGLEEFKLYGKHIRVGKTLKTMGLKKDGNEFPFEMSLSAWKTGKESYFTSIIRDITERANSEKALYESECKYRDLAELLPQMVFETDENGKLTFVNQYANEISGYSIKELIGLNMLEFLVPEDQDKALKNFQILLNGGKIGGEEFTVLNKDGVTFPVMVYTNLIIHEDKPAGVRGVVVDITDLKKSEKRLKRSIREKDLLIKEIHHRVKNNLQIISSLLELQETYVKEEPQAVNVLKESQNRVLSMAMIHEKLYESKDLSHINFYDYIQKLLYDLLNTYGVKNNTIIPVMNVDKILLNIETAIPLGLIISEIISNSIKYAFPNNEVGNISIDLHNYGDELELIISDDGIGLPKNIDFRHNESSLGLRLVNSLVQQLDGSIELDRNQGTKFTINFKELKYKERI